MLDYMMLYVSYILTKLRLFLLFTVFIVLDHGVIWVHKDMGPHAAVHINKDQCVVC